MVGLCWRLRVGGQLSIHSAWEPWLWNSRGRLLGEQHKPPERKQTKWQPQRLRVKGKQKWMFAGFPCFFWLLKYKEWWGCGDYFFVLWGLFWEKMSHSGPCVRQSQGRWLCGGISLAHRICSHGGCCAPHQCYYVQFHSSPAAPGAALAKSGIVCLFPVELPK